MSTNPYDDEPTGGTLSAAEQAEYDRLAQEEADAVAARDDDKTDDTAPLAEDDPRAAHDPEVAASYPVENGAVRWNDAANEGTTDREASATYDTPWGRREMTHHEVADLAGQGVVCTPVDAPADTSLQQEKDDMAHVEFAPKSDKA